MAEYIEREAVHEKLTQLMKDLDVYNCDECQNCESYKYGLDCDDDCFCGKVADYLIGNDVAPVVHGEWEIILDDFDCEFMRCSCCGEEFYNGDEDTIDRLHNYCPNCGARMDGDRRETQCNT